MEEIEIKKNCGTIATWSTFMGVMCAISAGMLILMGLFFIVAAICGIDLGEDMPTWFFIIYAVIFPIIGAAYILPCIYCFKVGKYFNRLQKTDDHEDFKEGFRYITSTYKFIGIFTIASIILSIVIVVVAMIVAFATI